MDYGWKQMIHEKLPMPRGVARMCGHGCMPNVIMTMTIAENFMKNCA